jgi:hypothetical protein
MAVSSPRLHTITLGGGNFAIRSDSSTSGFSAIILPMRMPASLVTITLGFASSIRAARLAAAKPPNTTEWMAPQAHRGEHGEHRFGRHRHVDEDAVALAHAVRLQDRREAVHLVVQLRDR